MLGHKKGQTAMPNASRWADIARRAMESGSKGQTAMEYLATYGWSLFALFVVVALLAASGVFSSERFAVEECTLQPNMPCKNYYMYHDATANEFIVSFEVVNAVGSPVAWHAAMLETEGYGVATVWAIKPYTNQGESTTYTFTFGAGPNFRSGYTKKAKLNITYSVCEGYPDYVSCALGAPTHTTAGKLDAYVRRGN